MKNLGHYTDTNGIIGIFDSSSLRATNIRFLNDEQELIHAIDLIRERIKNATKHVNKETKPIFDDFTGKITDKLDSLENLQSESIFTLSFTENHDLLSQWRGYCPNNDGYCLVLDIQHIMNKAKSQFKNTHLLECIYDQDEKIQKIKNILSRSFKEYTESSVEKKEKVILEATDNFLILASHFKHSSFSEEAEKRIVISLNTGLNNEIKFRKGKFSIIPFIDIEINLSEAIKEIIIGPTPKQHLSKKGMEILLWQKLDFNSFSINLKTSDTPYRS